MCRLRGLKGSAVPLRSVPQPHGAVGSSRQDAGSPASELGPGDVMDVVAVSLQLDVLLQHQLWAARESTHLHAMQPVT